jgi:hypothetical protein
MLPVLDDVVVFCKTLKFTVELPVPVDVLPCENVIHGTVAEALH